MSNADRGLVIFALALAYFCTLAALVPDDKLVRGRAALIGTIAVVVVASVLLPDPPR